MALKTSVNIKFDVGNDEFVRRYIPSPSHAEALKGIFNGVENNGNSSHIVVGPYGTGKSLLGTVVSSIISNSTSSTVVNKLINKFRYFDDYIADQLESSSTMDRKYLPVLLTGNEGRFREVIISNIVRKLKAVNINVVLPGKSENIINSIVLWEKEFPNTYNLFITEINHRGINIDEWLLEINKQNEKEILFFDELYPKLTSGASLSIGYNGDFITQMEYLSNILIEENIGIYIVYDEFGRFLQGLKSSELNEAMQDIQDLAEIVSRSKALQLMLITHKSLRQYFQGSNNEVTNEFQRIEKRFSQYHLTSDQGTFLEIAEIILTENIENKPQISDEQYDHIIYELKKFTLFPSLNLKEREERIIKSMYPMHPVALYLLPNLSGVFGQNERTLFTFLESEETGGLKNHMYKSDDYYTSAQLFDYFFPDLNDIDVDNLIKEHLTNYKKALARIPDTIQNRSLAISTLKFITLWELCGLQSEQKLSNDFISFSMQNNNEELMSTIQELSENKVIRFNRINNYWEIHSGSVINLQEKIESKKNNYIIKQNDILKVLKQNQKINYFFPEEYNDIKGMTRFAKVEILVGSELDKINIEFLNKADLIILYIIPEDKEDFHTLINKVNNFNLNKNVLCAIHSQPLRSIKEDILDSYVVTDLLNDKELLAEDRGSHEELNLIAKEINFVISNYLSALIEFDGQVLWFNSQKSVDLENGIDLSNLLSKVCFELYSHTPVILNDSFNRINISSAQKKAAIDVVNNIIKSPKESQFGIEGNGPDYAIYASIFKRNGNFYKNVNSYQYETIEYEPYKILRERLIELLDSKSKGTLDEIVNIFTGYDFGIRKSIIPILLVSMLRDRWNEFMLYRNEMYIQGLSGEVLFEILYEEGSENYYYVYEKYDEEYIELFNFIEENFKEHLEDRIEGKSRLIKSCSTLLNWLRSLPRFTQISNSVDEEFLWFRECIRKTEVKPQESISELYKEFKKKSRENILLIKNYAEEHINIFENKLLEDIYEIFGVSSISLIKEWSINSHEYLNKNNKLVRVINTNDNNKDWLNQFIESYIGVRVKDWSDTTHNLFIDQLNNDFKDANNFIKNPIGKELEEQFFSIEVGGKTKVISNVEFSVKSNTVYKNVDRMLKNAGRSIPKNEVELIVYKLLEEYVD